MSNIISQITNAEIQIDTYSAASLNKLTPDELIERLESMSNQYYLIRWKIFWVLRQKFTSDRLFGQYLNKLRANPRYKDLLGKNQRVYRSCCAGKFCEEHNITDLAAVGLQATSVYHLAEPRNASVADKVYHEIKGKGKIVPVSEVMRLIKQAKAITTDDYEKSFSQELIDGEEKTIEEDDTDLSEEELYPLLAEYLKSKFHLKCRRINEKTSSNNKGKGGNHWLHPDIVAMETLDNDWHESVRTYAKQGGTQSINLWSFEVKTKLIRSNVRESFFQALSNSKWANRGYLVAAHISDNVKQELKMLSGLYGIGVILLRPENPSTSEILLEAKYEISTNPDLLNRLTKENDDFKKFIDDVNYYRNSGRSFDLWM
jgi:hypothetical protein